MQAEFVEIYTDGSLIKGNVGGWGCLLRQPSMDYERELSGSELNTTNNRMELTAVIKGLEALKAPCYVGVTSDSQYVVNSMISGWVRRWKSFGWHLGPDGSGPETKNVDLWQILLSLCEIHTVKFQWVRGHDGNIDNERVDVLATTAAKLLQEQVRDEASGKVPALSRQFIG